MENNNTNYDYATPQFAESYTGSNEDFDYFEEVDLDSIEFEADGLSEMDALRIEIDDELEQTLQKMEELENDLEEGQAGKLADAIKENVMSTIKGQFGIASLLIESKDGGSVTTAHNMKKKYELEHEVDKAVKKQQAYVGYYEKAVERKDTKKATKHENKIEALKQEESKHRIEADKYKDIVRDPDSKYYDNFKESADNCSKIRTEKYELLHGKMRDKYKENNPTWVDDKYNPGHKVSTDQQYTYDEAGKKHNDQYSSANLDHVATVQEIEKSAEMHLAGISQEERVKIACNDANYAYTSEEVNKAKGSLSNKEFLKTKEAKQLIAEGKLDPEAMMQADKEARKHVYREANKKLAKKYTKELVTTGAKDSLKTGVYAMFVPLLTDVAKAVFDELKAAIALRKEGKKWKEVLKHFKERIGIVIENIKTKIKAEWDKIVGNGVWAAITAFLSNIVVFLINTFATTLKKIVSMIRAGFASIMQAIRTVTTNPQKLSDEDKWFEAGKILATGVIGAVSLGLSAALETLITTTIPFLTPISNIVSTVLSAIGGGIVSSILVYYMDKAHARNQKDKLQIQLVNKSGQVVQLRVAQAWFAVSDANLSVQKTANTLQEAKYHAVNMVTDSFKIQAELDAYIDETDKYVEELFNL